MEIKSEVEKSKLPTLAKREAKSGTMIFGLLGALFILASVISLPLVERSFEVNFMAILYLILMGLGLFIVLGIVLFILFKWFYYLKKNVWSNITFEFSTDRVETRIDFKQLNFFNKWSYRKMVRRYGVKINQKILIRDLRKTRIKKHKIQFYDNSNLLNPLVFPKEIEHYEEIKAIVNNNPKQYKLFQPDDST